MFIKTLITRGEKYFLKYFSYWTLTGTAHAFIHPDPKQAFKLIVRLFNLLLPRTELSFLNFFFLIERTACASFLTACERYPLGQGDRQQIYNHAFFPVWVDRHYTFSHATIIQRNFLVSVFVTHFLTLRKTELDKLRNSSPLFRCEQRFVHFIVPWFSIVKCIIIFR